MAYVTGQIVDYSNEKSSYRIATAPITALNITDFLADSGDLQLAIDDIILGDRAKQGWIGDDDILTSVPAASPLAQVEWAWLVTYQGDVNKKLYQVSIATADPQNGHLQANSDMADLANPDMAAFVTAFQTLARVPEAPFDQTVTVARIQLVGRNR